MSLSTSTSTSPDPTFYGGVYAAKVYSTADPMKKGRIQMYIPQVFGGQPVKIWAPSCAPGSTVPAVGTVVWCFFQGGDPAYPVYMPNALPGGGSGGGGGTTNPLAGLVARMWISNADIAAQSDIAFATGTALLGHVASGTTSYGPTAPGVTAPYVVEEAYIAMPHFTGSVSQVIVTLMISDMTMTNWMAAESFETITLTSGAEHLMQPSDFTVSPGSSGGSDLVFGSSGANLVDSLAQHIPYWVWFQVQFNVSGVTGP